MECKQCHGECRVRADPDEVKDGVTWTVQYYYCVKHGDQYRKLSTEDTTNITPVR